MELLIALLVALGIVTSEDAKYGKISMDDAKVMAAKLDVDEEVMAKYERSEKDVESKIINAEREEF